MMRIYLGDTVCLNGGGSDMLVTYVYEPGDYNAGNVECGWKHVSEQSGRLVEEYEVFHPESLTVMQHA